MFKKPKFKVVQVIFKIKLLNNQYSTKITFGADIWNGGKSLILSNEIIFWVTLDVPQQLFEIVDYN